MEKIEASEAGSTENSLAHAPVGRLLLRFAVPSVLTMLVNALYNIVDQIFIGRAMGYLGNGAANVVGLISTCAIATAMLAGDGAAAYFSLNLGAGRPEKAARGAANSLLFTAGAGLFTMVLCFLFLKPILRLFGCTAALLPPAAEYATVLLVGLPFLMVSMALNALIRADGSPKVAMLSVVVGTVVNGVLDPILIFGLGWGMRGAAAATVIGQLLSFAVSLSYLWRFRSIRLDAGAAKPRPKVLLECCSLGISSFIDQFAFTLVMAVNNHLVVTYGKGSPYGSEIPLTAFGISMKVQEILFTVLLGIALGMQPIVGYNYGAGKFQRVKRAYFLAITAGTVLSACAVVLFLASPDTVVRLFGSGDDTLYMEFSRKLFRTYYLFYVFFGFQTITGVFFQAIGRAGKAAALSLTYQLVFKILFAVLLSMALGLSGVLWSGPLADLLIFLLTLFMLLRQVKEFQQRGGGVRLDGESAV